MTEEMLFANLRLLISHLTPDLIGRIVAHRMIAIGDTLFLERVGSVETAGELTCDYLATYKEKVLYQFYCQIPYMTGLDLLHAAVNLALPQLVPLFIRLKGEGPSHFKGFQFKSDKVNS